MTAERTQTKAQLDAAMIRNILSYAEFNHQEGLWADVTVCSHLGGSIEINRIDVEAPYRQQGKATRFLTGLCEIADQYGFKIELEVGGPLPLSDDSDELDDENTVQDLPAFYMKFGFVWADRTMVRTPDYQRFVKVYGEDN